MQNNNILKSGRTNTEKIMEWILCPISEKSNLNLEEAAAYSVLSINKLRNLTNEKNADLSCGLAISG